MLGTLQWSYICVLCSNQRPIQPLVTANPFAGKHVLDALCRWN